MSALLLVPLILALASLFAAGLLSGDCSLALSVALLRLRYAGGAAEGAGGVLSVLGAALACTAGGTGTALSAAGSGTSRWAGRAAVTLISAPEGLLDV